MRPYPRRFLEFRKIPPRRIQHQHPHVVEVSTHMEILVSLHISKVAEQKAPIIKEGAIQIEGKDLGSTYPCYSSILINVLSIVQQAVSELACGELRAVRLGWAMWVRG